MPSNARFLRQLRITATAAAFVALVVPYADAHADMPVFEASYEVHYGILHGTMTLELERHAAEYTYRTSLRPRGIASWLRRGEIEETSRLVSVDGQIRPVDYISTDTIARPTRRANYIFDRPIGRVTGEYKSQRVDVPMRTDGQNRISAQVAIIRALQSSTELDEFAVFDRGRWRDFQFEVLRGQSVDTPSGHFDTVEVRYTSGDSQKIWSLHCAETLNYLPVVILFSEDGKVKSRAELTKFRIPDKVPSN